MFTSLIHPANNILLFNLANSNIRTKRHKMPAMKNNSNNEVLLRRAYAQAFGQISKEDLPKIMREAIYLRPFNKNRSKTASLLLLQSSAISTQPPLTAPLQQQPARVILALYQSPFQYNQFRQFHSGKKATSEQRFGSSQNTAEESSWSKFFSDFKKLQKSPTYDDYKVDVTKLDENEKKAYNQGFVRGMYTNNPATGTKEKSLIRKVGVILLVGVIAYYGLKLLKVFSNVSFEFINPQTFQMEQEVNVTFDDVCGVDEAKLELQEIVDYLRDPTKYTRLGARLPKGVLLVGPPGTGKTLLARAIAGEAGVAFFHSSGSEFDEMLVGQGARRIRDLFKKAIENAPCVIFIDEIDSVGAKRTSSSLHPYANQTINQLLSEMDGFVQNEGVIVIGATNKKEHLDSALLRPGRFDIQVHVQIPDLMGRKEIFQLYLDKVIHDDYCDSMKLSRGTYGFTGAGIENMVNQAALKAASEGANKVTMRHLDEARDRILMGPARIKGRHLDEEANKNTAYHEAGHAIVALYTKHSNPLHKVTIIPRGGSLGHTAQLPEKDQLQQTKAQMLAQLDVAMGGRVAEELIFGEENVTTGATSDLKNATGIAESMVKMFGMSGRVGLRDFTSPAEENELGAFGRGPQTSDQIDEEIKRILQESYDRAKDMLIKHKTEHRLLAEALLEYETLNKQEVERVIKGEKLKKLVTTIKTPTTTGGVKKRAPPAVTFIPDRRTTSVD